MAPPVLAAVEDPEFFKHNPLLSVRLPPAGWEAARLSREAHKLLVTQRCLEQSVRRLAAKWSHTSLARSCLVVPLPTATARFSSRLSTEMVHAEMLFMLVGPTGLLPTALHSLPSAV